MNCIYPYCGYDDPVGRETKLYEFPQEKSLRTEWLTALGTPECDLQADSAVCSKHFLTEDFLLTRSGHKLRPDAVPVVNVEVCRICFTTDSKLYPMKDNTQFDLSKPSYALAYETLTGLLIDQTVRLPPYLCDRCAQQLLKCVRFRARSIRAHSMLMEIVSDYGYITLDTILAVTKLHLPLTSDITCDQLDSKQTDSDNSYIYNPVQQEDISDGGIKTESIDVVNNDILITDIRSTTDAKHSSNVQHDSEIITIKREKYDINNKDNQKNDVTPYNTVREDTADDILTESDIIEQNINDKSNNSAVNKEDIDKSDFNDDNTGVIRDKGCSLNGSFPSTNTIEKDEISQKRGKGVTTVPTDLTQSKINGNRKSDCKGGLLLSYKLLACEICHYQTVSKVQLMQHLETHSDKVYNCKKCYFLTKSKKHLQLHTAIHCKENSHSCDICKIFTHRSDLRIHMRTHSGEKPFACDICTKKCTQYSQLRVHLRIHSGEKPYFCKVCSKTFKQKGQLQNHLRIHSGEKPFSCDVCNKAFIQRGQLQQHFLIHTNEKPYSCHICGKSFRTKGIMQNHLRLHANKRSL